MKKFFFGEKPKGSSSQGESSSVESQHRSSLAKLYNKLLGESEVRDRKTTEEDFVHWDQSSSPVKLGKSPPDSKKAGSQQRPQQESVISRELSTEDADLSDMDPAQELLGKFSGCDIHPPLTAPNIPTETALVERNDANALVLHTPRRHTATKARRSESALATIVPVNTGLTSFPNKASSSKAALGGGVDPLHSNLYSPGYLKRSVSLERAYPLKTKRHEKSHENENQSHFAELISLVSTSVDPKSCPTQSYSSASLAPENLNDQIERKEEEMPKKTEEQKDEDDDDDSQIDILELDRLLSQAPAPASNNLAAREIPPKSKSTSTPVVSISTSDLESTDCDSDTDDGEMDVDLQELDNQIKSTQAPGNEVSRKLDNELDNGAEDYEVSNAGAISKAVIDHLTSSLKASSQIDIKTIKLAIRQKAVTSQSLHTTINHPNVLRFLVVSIEDDSDQHQLNLNVKSELGIITRLVLRGAWYYDAFVEVGDIVQIIIKERFGTSNTADTVKSAGSDALPKDDLIVDDTHNLLIVNPDILLTCTAVSQSFSCQRRVVLQSRIKSSQFEQSKAMIYGSIIHELFQDALTSRNFSSDYLLARINDLVNNTYSEELFLAGVARHQAVHELKTEYLPIFPEWKTKFFDSQPFQGSNLIEYPTKGDADKPRLFIKDVLDIEQEVWSPVYGLKGNIDATVLANVEDMTGIHDTIVPFELKTSKSSKTVAHRAQTVLYTLLLAERYSLQDTPFGLLCYICIDEMIRVSVAWRELTALIVGRNSLAQYYRSTVKENDPDALLGVQPLPAPIKDEFICKRCDWSEECPVYNYASEGSMLNNDGYPDIFVTNVEHLTSAHRDFFSKWNRLLALEETTMTTHRKLIWTSASRDREELGDCFGGLKVLELQSEVLLTKESGAGKNKVYRYRLGSSTSGSDYGVTAARSNFLSGDRVVVSDENGHICLASGTFLRVEKSSIMIQTNRELKPDVVYRVDRDELYSGMNLARRNIVDLFKRNGDARRRDFVVDLQAPRFLSTGPAYDLNTDKFNADQVKVIDKVLRTVDYSLILGMPGTGKTTTIAEIIDILINQLGKTVLVASQTHSAVDNIVLKLKNRGFGILRVGAHQRVHPDVREFLLDGPISNGEDFERKVMRPPLVAVTCYAISDWVLSKRPTFDYCIVDEASQITLPTCLGPLKLADKFILVGDHFQLSPLVKSPQALADGLDVSLFKLLCTKHPSAVVNLRYQYRMCADIMTISNKLVYDGMLICGSDEVANRSLKLKLPYSVSLPDNQKWLTHVLSESTRVTFLDTDELPGWESKSGDGPQNFTEARIAKIVVDSLCSCGILESDIGVLSVYKAQIRLLKQELAARKSRGLEILTADKSQGRDKDCVIISLVRSNQIEKVGDLLQDWRRLNVSFTRAKSKLIIIGSRKTLTLAAAMKEFLRLLHAQSWIYTIGKGGLDIDNSLPGDIGSQNSKPVQRSVNHQKLLQGSPILRDIVNEFT